MKILFFAFFVRPIIKIILGLNIKNGDRIPAEGPAIIIANHNSHLDTVALMCLFPLFKVKNIRPVAAADYWTKNKLITWFADTFIGIIPIKRKNDGANKEDLLAPILDALKQKKIVIYFPEGSRGNPEEMVQFKKGISHLAMNAPDVPVVPVFLYGLGKSLPRGEGLLVPFVCDVNIGEKKYWSGDKDQFIKDLQDTINKLGSETRNFEKDKASIYFG
jgi:1-acyl-sn-glycerol-3-phosphate acyltransferase